MAFIYKLGAPSKAVENFRFLIFQQPDCNNFRRPFQDERLYLIEISSNPWFWTDQSLSAAIIRMYPPRYYASESG